ncbi:tetratricopeptide repeat protein 5 [Platysternon megacephalum]|uniref:Tetratricopeptide repeat protein 5 n=1 Tax=Platysternon megacephalum TaxID=55544 RepID=A0A4D9E0N5_9SAUR|nr:tetratricopeptide repeat protein 5 [Platysternon megacephalum]
MSHVPDSHNMGEVRGECAAAHTSLSKVIVWHRQLALQLGGTADSPRLREELQERSKEAHELSKGKELSPARYRLATACQEQGKRGGGDDAMLPACGCPTANAPS